MAVYTLQDLESQTSRKLRDPGNATWTLPEIDDFINEGIDNVSAFYPLEATVTISLNSASYQYPAVGLTSIFRIDVWASTAAAPPFGFQYTLPLTTQDGPNAGWDYFGGTLYLPPNYLPINGTQLNVFGYKAFAQLSASTQVTDLDDRARHAVAWYCQYAAFRGLLTDRATFQQWQLNSNNTDVTAATMNQMALFAERQWNDRRNQLRKFRRQG